MKILPNVAWNFAGDDYPAIGEFDRAVATYNQKIMGKRANWQPDQVIVESPAVDIIYECWAKQGEPVADNEKLIAAYADDDFEEREVSVRFTADNGQSFTALELLHKIHQHLRPKELGDHTFFEGLTASEGDVAVDVPFFTLYCGS